MKELGFDGDAMQYSTTEHRYSPSQHGYWPGTIVTLKCAEGFTAEGVDLPYPNVNAQGDPMPMSCHARGMWMTETQQVTKCACIEGEWDPDQERCASAASQAHGGGGH